MPLSDNRQYRYPNDKSSPDLAAHLAALAEDVDLDMETVAALAAAATNAADNMTATMDESGIMRGYASVPLPLEDSIWRQTTESGYYLPLGYTKELGLDAWARKIWLRDINHAEEILEHPLYARAMVTEDGYLLAALRWDGTVEVPGLAAVRGPATPVDMGLYSDAPFTPGSDILPSRANVRAWAMWGSSSAGGIGAQMQALAGANGATYTQGGQGGERSFHIAARLGSVPARLTFPGNTVPASGSAAVTSSNLTAGNANLRSYSGTISTVSGGTVAGSLSSDAEGALTFTRTTPGTAAEVSPDASLVPDLGAARRGDTTFLWMGKNNSHEPARVIRETDESFRYLAPLVKRCLVLGHFVNTGMEASSPSRYNIRTINDAHAARYGAAFLDVSGYLTGPQVWKDAGITPTAEDLAEQSKGNKPPSLSSDSGHLNTAGYAAVRALIASRLVSLGWVS